MEGGRGRPIDVSVQRDASEMKIRKFVTKERFLGMDAALLVRLFEDGQELRIADSEVDEQVDRKMTEVIDLMRERNEGMVERLRVVKDRFYEAHEAKEMPQFLEGFSDEERQALALQLNSIELTFGCSLACPDCAQKAVPRKKSMPKIAFEDLVFLFRQYRPQFEKSASYAYSFMPYYASEPLDWEEAKRDYQDIHELIDFYMHDDKYGRAYVSTGYPSGSKELFQRLLDKKYINRLSVTSRNVGRLVRDGFVQQEDDGTITGEHPHLRRILRRESAYVDPDSTRRKAYGHAFGDENRAGQGSIGGINSLNQVLLRVDGFYNQIVTSVKKGYEAGDINRPIDPEKIRLPIDIENPPKTIEELMDRGIVSRMYTRKLRQNMKGGKGTILLDNFHEGKKHRYVVDYDYETHEVQTIVEQREGFEKEFRFLVDATRRQNTFKDYMKETTFRRTINRDLRARISREMDFSQVDFSQPEAKAGLERYREIMDKVWHEVYAEDQGFPALVDLDLTFLKRKQPWRYSEDMWREVDRIVYFPKNVLTLLEQFYGNDESFAELKAEINEKILKAFEHNVSDFSPTEQKEHMALIREKLLGTQ